MQERQDPEVLVQPGQANHLVQFYKDESFFQSKVAQFLSAGLVARERVIVIATRPHCDGLSQTLASSGIQVARAVQNGQLTFLDARETLARFMAGDMPDEGLFTSLIRDELERNEGDAPQRRIRLFGEMVDLLSRDGNTAAAVRLEEMWNALLKSYQCSLLCAYVMGNFYRERDGDLLSEICKVHTHVLPDEVASRNTTEPHGIVLLQQRALALEAEIECRKQLEHSLREALAQRRSVEEALRQSNRDLDQFAFVASHDLKAPLRAIGNLAKWIEEDLGAQMNAQSKEHLGLLFKRVEKMEALIDAILSYSQVGQRQVEERVDVAELLAEVVETLAPPSEVSISIGEMPIFDTERVPLYQVFQNLLGNAIKYRRPLSAQVSLRAKEGEGCLEFIVQDNGPGIPAKFHESIFQPFTRVSAAQGVEGSGIGLSVVRKIAEMRGGRVWVESTPPNGSTFHVLWPRSSPSVGGHT